jgi:hypothetical protein
VAAFRFNFGGWAALILHLAAVETQGQAERAERLSDEMPDAALEVAAGKYGESGNPFTIAFCSVLDTSPA